MPMHRLGASTIPYLQDRTRRQWLLISTRGCRNVFGPHKHNGVNGRGSLLSIPKFFNVHHQGHFGQSRVQRLHVIIVVFHPLADYRDGHNVGCHHLVVSRKEIRQRPGIRGRQPRDQPARTVDECLLESVQEEDVGDIQTEVPDASPVDNCDSLGLEEVKVPPGVEDGRETGPELPDPRDPAAPQVRVLL